MALLKEDGGLNVEWVRNLPIEEFVKVYRDLTEEQENEYWSKIPKNETQDKTRADEIDAYIDNNGADAMDLLNNIMEKYGTKRKGE